MQKLPLEMVSAISGCLSSRSVIALSKVEGEGIGQTVRDLHPVLHLTGSPVPWNEFASSEYDRIEGSGMLSMPADDRMMRASRRLRGNLSLFIGSSEVPEDVLRCLRVRALMYPYSLFCIAATEFDIVRWFRGHLTLILPLELWERFRLELRVLSELPITSLSIDYTSHRYNKNDNKVFADLLSLFIPTLLFLEHLTLSGPYFPLLSPSVHTIEIRGPDLFGKPVGYVCDIRDNSYNAITTLILRDFNELEQQEGRHSQRRPPLDSGSMMSSDFMMKFTRTTRRLPALRYVVLYTTESFHSALQEITQELHTRFPALTFEVLQERP